MSVESVISRELMRRGFLRKGKRSFYLRKNDIIALFSFERPTGVLYLQFAVIPLFLPCPGHITFSFGRRLDSLFHDLPTITKETTKEQMQEYCALALEHIDHDVLPVIHQYSTAASLNAYAKRRLRFLAGNNTKMLFCTPQNALELLVYSSLTLKEYSGAEKAARKIESYIHRFKYYTPELKEQILSKNNQIIEILERKDYCAVESILDRNINDNLSLFGEQFGSDTNDSREGNKKEEPDSKRYHLYQP